MTTKRFDYDREILSLGDLDVEPTYDEQVKPERYSREKTWYHSLVAQRSRQTVSWTRDERFCMLVPEGIKTGEEDD